ncbi:hypothetical protein HDR61_00585 [bacterium]|nr:hypothetical protein [bacterium]
MVETTASGTKGKTKAEFNVEYGKFLQAVRMDFGLTLENASELADISIDALKDCEGGNSLELYYLLRLWELYKMN